MSVAVLLAKPVVAAACRTRSPSLRLAVFAIKQTISIKDNTNNNYKCKLEHNVAIMAVHWRIQRRTDISCMVLWVIVTIASGVDCSSSFSTDSEALSSPPHVDSVVYYKLKRSAEEDSLPPAASGEIPDVDVAQEEQDETQTDNEKENSESLISEETSKEPDPYEEQKKSKQTNKQKYLGNEFKNPHKVILEAKKSNSSIADKQILGTQEYQLKPGYLNKKEKSNSSLSDFKANDSNPAVPNINSLESIQKKGNVEKESGPTNESEEKVEDDPEGARLNDTLVMNDQPQPQPVELPHNSTSTVSDFSDDESLEDVLSQNITDVEDHNNTTNADGRTMPATEGMDFAVISGITLGTLVLLGLFAGGGFVIYRHRMWNKPQTLSDKCSNADSSGYIDDSTLRENSEEMYSLDNDSFLNSLEAMTIQNYWTDNVKHTKL